MILTIKFLNYKNEEILFKWKLVDKSYAVRWSNLMNSWKETWINGVPRFKDKWFISSSNQDFLDYIEKIKNLVDLIDSIGEHYVGSEHITENISRDELNRIHEEFHRYIEKVKSISDKTDTIQQTEELCHQLNDLVHLTEIAKKNQTEQQPDKRIIATSLPHMQVDYEEEDYDSYVSSMCEGWIYVGYATPGKSLFHCFSDNDVQVVKDQLVRQSQGLSNELHIELSGKDKVDLNFEKEIKDKFYSWCEEHQVVDYGYDFRNSIYNPGRIPLAFPIDDVSTLIKFFDSKQGSIVDILFED